MTAHRHAHSLETELRTFRAHRDELIGRARGKYVLIHGEEIVDFFENQTDALTKGFRKFGNNPFLVKLVTEVEVPLNFTMFNVGV